VATVPAVATTTSALAADLGVDPGDVDVLLELLDERTPVLPDDLPPSCAMCSTRTANARR
jgi:hypothetical protein